MGSTDPTRGILLDTGQKGLSNQLSSFEYVQVKNKSLFLRKNQTHFFNRHRTLVHFDVSSGIYRKLSFNYGKI